MTFFKDPKPWSESDIKKLIRLIDQGKTRFEIADEFKERSRNAVVAKIRTSGFTEKVKIDSKHKGAKNLIDKMLYREQTIFTEEDHEPLTTVYLVSKSECRWPILKGKSKQWCCGHPLMEDDTYCDYHASFAHVRPKSA